MSTAEKAVASLNMGEHAQRKTGSGEKFWQFRPYNSGDRPLDIDWRQSAKGDHVYVRQKEQQTPQTVLFWVQNDQGMSLQHARALNSKYAAGIIISLGLGLLLTRAGEQIGLLSDPMRTNRSNHAVDGMGHILCQQMEALPIGPSLPVIGTLQKGASVVLCGDFMCPTTALDMSLRIISEKADRGMLVQILDPLEYDLPHNGRAIFRPLDDSMEFPISNVASIRTAYQERLLNHIEMVRKIAINYRFGHVLHITRDDPRLALSSVWQKMAPQPKMQAGA